MTQPNNEFAFRRATDEELRLPLLKEKILAEYDTLFLDTMYKDDGYSEEREILGKFLSTALDTYGEAVRREERKRIKGHIEQYGHASYDEFTHELESWTLYGSLDQLHPPTP